MHVNIRFSQFFIFINFSVNSATRLEAHISYESKSSNLERTFAIDTVIYILNRLFKFHQDVLDSGW